MAEFKDMLKYFRLKENLSQIELAGKLGVSASTISMYEVGKREPDFETEEKIADFFNVDLNTLRGKDTEQMPLDSDIRRIQRARSKMSEQENGNIQKMAEPLYGPHELETIEIDIENKIFKVNGEDFGKGCFEVSIDYAPDKWSIRMELVEKIVYENYDRHGKHTEENVIHTGHND